MTVPLLCASTRSASRKMAKCADSVDLATGKRVARVDVNDNGFKDSYTGDLAFDRAQGLLYVVDQANFRLVTIDTKKRNVLGSVKTGRPGPLLTCLSAVSVTINRSPSRRAAFRWRTCPTWKRSNTP